MSGAIAAVPVSEITSGAQLFRCVPYSCTMLVRACVERQAKAALGLETNALLKCKGCELGAEVKARAAGVVVDEASLIKHARSSGHHRGGVLAAKMRAPKNNPTPPALEHPPEPIPVPAATSAPPKPPTEETIVPELIDLTGKPVAGVTVVGRAPSTGKGASWRVKYPCGHEANITAANLTYYVKTGSNLRCKEDKCRPPLKQTLARAKSPRRGTSAEAPAARDAAPRQRRQLPETAPTDTPSPATHAHEFPLRRDFKVRLELPTDLSRVDVQRLARFLEALVFDDQGEAGAAE